MFERLRKPGRAKSIFATLIFGAICLVFVLFGMNPGNGMMQAGGAAARVNEAVISSADYNQAVRRMQEQFSSRLEGLPEAQRTYFDKTIRTRALEELIMFELISQRAEKQGLKVASGEIRQKILAIPVFQEDGHFSRERYDQILQANNLYPQSFETKLGKEILLTEMQRLFMNSLKTIPQEAEQNKLADSLKVNLSVAKFNREQIIEKIPVKSQQLDEYLKANKEKVDKYFSDNKTKYSSPEEVSASHILIKFKSGDKTSEKQAEEKIRDLAAKVNVKNFGEMAKKFSEDEGSKTKSGELGFFARGKMVKEFEDAAFQLEKGKISDPIKTNHGYHLIFVKDHHPAKTQNLEQVEKQIAQHMWAESQVEDVIKQIEKNLKENHREEVLKTLSSLGIKMESAGELALSQNFTPLLGESAPVFDEIAKRKTRSGLVPELVQNRGSFLVVDVKGITNSPPKKDPAALAPPDKRSNEIFETWYRNEQKKAHITRSTEMIASEE